MPAKQLLFGETARDKVLSGVTQLTNAVKMTMGPCGRNVLIEKPYGGPIVTKDGVSVAKEITLEDPFEDMGAQLVKEAATKTNDAAGDGTTTATVLAHAIMQKGGKLLGTGVNAISVKRGIDKAVAAIVVELEKMSKPVASKAEYKAIANISAQDEEVGEIISEVIDEVGKDGVVTVEIGQTFGIEKKFVEGMQFDTGYISPYFVTDTVKMESIFERPYILITDNKITSAEEVLPVIELLANKGVKELVIICDNIEGDALKTVVVNKLRGIFNTLAIKAPAFGDRRGEDLAILTGGKVITGAAGLSLKDVTLDDLGTASRVVSTKDHTVIVDGSGDKKAIQERIRVLQSAIKNSEGFDSEKIQERLAKLTGGVAIIKVGAASEIEQRERQFRVEDALSATRAAAEEGVLPGGGTAYLRAISVLGGVDTHNEDEVVGLQIVAEALCSPLLHIASNAGHDGGEVVDKVLAQRGNMGFNAMTGEYEDLVKAMVIDPVKVARCALENAASVASMFLTLEVAVTDVPVELPPTPMMPPGMPG